MKGFFQLIVVIIFIAGAIFGVLVFSGTIPLGGSSNKATGTVVVWGTIKNSVMASLVEQFNNVNTDFTVEYVEKSPDNFDQSLLEALASGNGPDMFFLPDNLAFHYANKIFTVPYTSYSLTTFKNTFAAGGEVFLTSNGLLAFPMTIDPLVMYYNRSILDSNAVVYPPKTWDELSNLVPILTKKDNTNKITSSAVALGHFSNISHAKDIIVAMFMQAGSPIVASRDGALHSSLSDSSGKYDLGSILEFYTSFASPAQPTYSWNKSFSNSTDAFSNEDLALYFGFSSEFQYLVNKNPNQNLGVAPIPQISNSSKVTTGKVTGIAISSASKNLTTAFTAASILATSDFASKLSRALNIAPARRDLLSKKPDDAFSPVFYDSALFARSWLDPSSKGSDDIFRNMVDATLSNNQTSLDAVDGANSRLDLLLTK